MASAGLAIPLLIVFALLAFIGCLLLSPKPLCTPGIALARATTSPTGNIVLLTLSSVLVLLLASPLWEAVQLTRGEHKGDW